MIETKSLARQGDVRYPITNVVALFDAEPHQQGVRDMERINQFSFYELGKALHRLSLIQGDVAPAAILMDLWGAQIRLKSLLDGKPISLGVSRTVTEQLRNDIGRVVDLCTEGENEVGEKVFKYPDGTEPLLESWKVHSLHDLASKFETVFQEEMREATTYFIPKKGIYSTASLIDAADETFPPEIAGFIPDKARVDWKAAGRCLALNLLTASGFHVCRAVEAAMESYYQAFCGKPGQTLKSWAEYIKALDGVAGQTPAPSEKTRAELKRMKDDYRNPVAHPRVTLTEPDARMLFSNGESLIIAMAAELKAVNSSGVQKNSLSLLAGIAMTKP